MIRHDPLAGCLPNFGEPQRTQTEKRAHLREESFQNRAEALSRHPRINLYLRDTRTASRAKLKQKSSILESKIMVHPYRFFGSSRENDIAAIVFIVR